MFQIAFTDRSRGLRKLGRNCITPDPSPSREAKLLPACRAVEIELETQIERNDEYFELPNSTDAGSDKATEEINMTLEGDSDISTCEAFDILGGGSDCSESLASSVPCQVEPKNQISREEHNFLRRERELQLANEKLAHENEMLRRQTMLVEQQKELLEENRRLQGTCQAIFTQCVGLAPSQDVLLANFGTMQLVTVSPHITCEKPDLVDRKQRPLKQVAAKRATKNVEPMPIPQRSNAPDELTTIMLRNLPNNYNLSMLLKLIDSEGFAGCYDFVYLPIDFVTEASLAYAFVNLTSHNVAERFRKAFDDFSNWIVPTRKRCIVGWSSPYQGLEQHIERFRNNSVMHESVPLKFKPAVFVNGIRVPFPAPTKKVRAPRVRGTRTTD